MEIPREPPKDARNIWSDPPHHLSILKQRSPHKMEGMVQWVLQLCFCLVCTHTHTNFFFCLCFEVLFSYFELVALFKNQEIYRQIQITNFFLKIRSGTTSFSVPVTVISWTWVEEHLVTTWCCLRRWTLSLHCCGWFEGFLCFFLFNTIFKGYTPFTVITNYWLYSPYCTVTPCGLFYTQ